MADYRRNNSHISVCNRLLVEKILPQAVKRFNAGGFAKDYFIFQERDFYKNVINQILTQSIAEEYTKEIQIERGRLPRSPYFLVIKLILPHNNEIGDTEIACVLIDTAKNQAAVYCMEKSFKDYMICQWIQDKHINYGAASNFSSFLSSIIPLAEESFKDVKSQYKTQTSHRHSVTPDFKSGTKIKKSTNKQRDWANIASYLSIAVMIGLIILIIVTTCNSRSSKSPAAATVQALVDTVQDIDTVQEIDIEPIESLDHIVSIPKSEEYLDMDKYDEWAGETFSYHPEDGTIRSSSGKILTKESASTSVKDHPQKTVKPIQDEYNGVEITRYSNGEYPYFDTYGRGKFDSNSLSRLSISNGTSSDAVVLLCDALGTVIRNVYVKKGTSLEINHIPACRCIIKVMFGNDWYKGKDNGSGFPKGGFTKDVSYTVSKWSDAFDFTPQYVEDGIDYPTYEITLHVVRNGNFQTKASNKNEFFKNKQ